MCGYITSCFMSVASGLAIYFTLVIIKQRWVRTLHHLITYLLLPPIAFVITNIISNNFALSLRMIGALSILNFKDGYLINRISKKLKKRIFSLDEKLINFGKVNRWEGEVF